MAEIREFPLPKEKKIKLTKRGVAVATTAAVLAGVGVTEATLHPIKKLVENAKDSRDGRFGEYVNDKVYTVDLASFPHERDLNPYQPTARAGKPQYGVGADQIAIENIHIDLDNFGAKLILGTPYPGPETKRQIEAAKRRSIQWGLSGREANYWNFLGEDGMRYGLWVEPTEPTNEKVYFSLNFVKPAKPVPQNP